MQIMFITFCIGNKEVVMYADLVHHCLHFNISTIEVC